MSGRHQRRVAVVTGATGGLGRAIAVELARRGWAVAVGYRTKRSEAASIAAAARRHGAGALALPLDVAIDVSVVAFVRSARALGPVTALVNVASFAAPGGAYRTPLADLDLQHVLRAVEVDVGGSLRMIRALAPGMRRAGGGAVVNFGSAGDADPEVLAYIAAKSGIAAYTRALARQLGPAIRVNCIAPGAIESDWLREWKMPAGERRALANAACLRRLGQPRDIAGVTAFLLSEDAAFVTGQTLAVDGGMFCP